jgi:hypothetical protein
MTVIGIAVAIVALAIVDIVTVQGLDYAAFNSNRAFPLYTKAIERSESAGLAVRRERREVKALGHAVVSTVRISKMSIGRLVTVNAQHRNSA